MRRIVATTIVAGVISLFGIYECGNQKLAQETATQQKLMHEARKWSNKECREFQSQDAFHKRFMANQIMTSDQSPCAEVE